MYRCSGSANARNVPSTSAKNTGKIVAGIFQVALELMDQGKGDKNDVELRTTLLKTQVEGAQG